MKTLAITGRYTLVSLIVFGPLVAICYGCFLLAHNPLPWPVLLTVAVLFVIRFYIRMFGISLGYHRYLTHQGFKAKPIIEFLILWAGSTAMQGPCLSWATVHREHHSHADKEGDPHSPLDGFWHAHFFWLYGWAFTRRHKMYDGPEYALARFMDATFLLWLGLDALICYVFFGNFGLIWLWLGCNGLFNQVTYCVNSVCHMVGYRNFETQDQSRNNRWLAWFTPEAFHNNHHRWPKLACHGFMKGEHDISYRLLLLLEKWKLVWDIDKPTARHMAAAAV